MWYAYSDRQTTKGHLVRLHSDSIERLDISKAATLVGVQFTRFTDRGSRSREAAFDVILTGSSPRNQGFGGEDKAATWDEWGHFLGTLFRLDPAMYTRNYDGAEQFHWMTGSRFADPERTFTRGHTHRWNFEGDAVTGSYHVHECKCGALRRFMRYGMTFADLSQ